MRNRGIHNPTRSVQRIARRSEGEYKFSVSFRPSVQQAKVCALGFQGLPCPSRCSEAATMVSSSSGASAIVIDSGLVIWEYAEV